MDVIVTHLRQYHSLPAQTTRNSLCVYDKQTKEASFFGCLFETQPN